MSIAGLFLYLLGALDVGPGVHFEVRHGQFYDYPTHHMIAVPGRVDGEYIEMVRPGDYERYRRSRFYRPGYVIYHEAFDLGGMVHAVYLPSLERSLR